AGRGALSPHVVRRGFPRRDLPAPELPEGAVRLAQELQTLRPPVFLDPAPALGITTRHEVSPLMTPPASVRVGGRSGRDGVPGDLWNHRRRSGHFTITGGV